MTSSYDNLKDNLHVSYYWFFNKNPHLNFFYEFSIMAKLSQEINPAGIQISKYSDTPLYVQVYDQFRSMILEQRLRAGDRLPPSRNLAKELAVSRVIISQAFEQLMMEGYLVGKTGSGTFVADNIPDLLLNAGKKMAHREREEKRIENISKNGDRLELIPFQTGAPALDVFPYKAWQDAGNKVLKSLKGSHLGYENTLGYWQLRKAIASYLRVARAVRCEAEQVIVVTGSQQGLNLMVECLLKKNDKVWMEDPGYFGAKDAFTNAGVDICPVPVEDDGLDLRYAKENFPDAKLAYVTPSHQFPMGCTLSQEKRIALLQWANEKNMWIIEDDYDSEFRYEGRPLASLQGMDTNGKVIYSGTFSKVLFPGLRLAYIVLPDLKMVNEFKNSKTIIDRQSPVLDQLILTRFMEEGFFLRHIRKMRLLYAERQNILISLLQKHLQDHFSLTPSPSGMQLICWLSDQIDLEKFKKEIEMQKLSISFISNYTITHHRSPAITLGFTAFSKYKMKIGVEKLVECVQASLK